MKKYIVLVAICLLFSTTSCQKPEPTDSEQSVQKGSEIVKDTTDVGADVNAKDNEGMTPLMHAVRAEDAETSENVRNLIAAGADVNAKDNDGWTPLMHARDEDIVKALISAGADVNAKNIEDKTPLMFAEVLACASALIAAGADVNAKDIYGGTTLMFAVEAKKIENVKLLISAGADVNAKDNNGWTALMFARDENIVKALIAAGADVNAKDKNGNSVSSHYHIAIEELEKSLASLDEIFKAHKCKDQMEYDMLRGEETEERLKKIEYENMLKALIDGGVKE